MAGTFLVVLKRFPLLPAARCPLPAAMLVIVFSIAVATFFDPNAMGVQEVGALQSPDFQVRIPKLPLDQWLRSGELAFGLVVLLLAES